MVQHDLENHIMSCWGIIDDIKLLSSKRASPQDFESLATLYEYRFQQVWDSFEQLLKERHRSNNGS